MKGVHSVIIKERTKKTLTLSFATGRDARDRFQSEVEKFKDGRLYGEVSLINKDGDRIDYHTNPHV